MNESRLVYSTETGRICPGCGRAAGKCNCKKKKGKPAKPSGFPDDGIVRIRRDVKGRRGKTVTSVFGVPLEGKQLQEFAKTLKRRCGTGGTLKDGVIVIQGDKRDMIIDELRNHGWTVKLAGG